VESPSLWTDLVAYFGKGHLWDIVFLGVLGALALAIKLMDWFGARPGGRRRFSSEGQLHPTVLVTDERLEDVAGLGCDANGNLFAAAGERNMILRVTADGALSAFAGDGEEDSADGPAAQARFDGPEDVVVDSENNVYVAEGGSDRIRAIAPDGRVTTLAGGDDGFADGSGAQAQFDGPCGVAVDGSGNVYVADWGNNRVRVVAPDGTVSTLAGSGAEDFADGPAAQAAFNGPNGVAVDAQGNVFVADSGNHRIRRIDRGGVVSTFAGSGKRKSRDGVGVRASFLFPTHVVCRPSGGLLVIEAGCAGIRRVDGDGKVTTLRFAGTAEPVPDGIACTPDGGAVVSDELGQRLLKISKAELDG
jgi:sugar lactone lactonase YvrE